MFDLSKHSTRGEPNDEQLEPHPCMDVLELPDTVLREVAVVDPNSQVINHHEPPTTGPLEKVGCLPSKRWHITYDGFGGKGSHC